MPLQKLNLLNGNHLLVWHKNLGPAQYVNSVYDLAEKSGQAQNILGPVKGRYNGPFAIAKNIFSFAKSIRLK